MVETFTPWTSLQAAEWSRAGPPRWLHPRLAVFGWIIAFTALVIADHSSGANICTETQPCSSIAAAWARETTVAGFLVLPFLLWWRPHIGWLTTPATLAFLIVVANPPLDRRPAWAGVAVVASAVWTYGALIVQAVGRRRQARVADGLGDRARGTSAATKGQVPIRLPRELYRGRQLWAGALLLFVAVVVVAVGTSAQREEVAKRARVERLAGEVLDHPTNDVVTVKMPWGPGWRAERVEVSSAAGYPIGTTITVLRQGDRWIPASGFLETRGFMAIAGAAALVGVSMLTSAFWWRLSLAALANGTVPAMRVLVRTTSWDRAMVYAADDGGATQPLLAFPARIASSPLPEGSVSVAEFDELMQLMRQLPNPPTDRKEMFRRTVEQHIYSLGVHVDPDDGEPHPAVLYGRPHDGAVLAAQVDGSHTLLAPRDRARLHWRVPFSMADERTTAVGVPKYLGGPVTWRHSPTMLALISAGLLLSLLVPLATPLLIHTRLDLLLALLLSYAIAVTRLYRSLCVWVVADTRGVTVVRLRSERTLPWDEIDVAAEDPDSTTPELMIYAKQPARSIEGVRLLGASNRTIRVADEINALIDNPSLRPAGVYPAPRSRLAVLAILLALYGALVTVGVLL